MNDREVLANLICLGTDDSCKEYCNLQSDKVCVRCETLADCLISNGVTVQKHGRWELNQNYGDYECSVCGQGDVIAPHFSKLKMNYCPNCGANMDGEAHK